MKQKGDNSKTSLTSIVSSAKIHRFTPVRKLVHRRSDQSDRATNGTFGEPLAGQYSLGHSPAPPPSSPRGVDGRFGQIVEYFLRKDSFSVEHTLGCCRNRLIILRRRVGIVDRMSFEF